MKNWKTFVSALITAFFGFVLFSPGYFAPWLVDVAKFATAGGLLAFGLFAKDHDVSGGTKQQ
jgi:hypothetical protein